MFWGGFDSREEVFGDLYSKKAKYQLMFGGGSLPALAQAGMA